MNHIEFQLFRIKFIRSKQLSIFDTGLTPNEIFVDAIKEKPSLQLRQDYHWHIGNITFVDEQSGYFAFGRTTKAIVEKYDEITGNFKEEDSETSPYAHVLFEANLELLAISKKTKLAPTTIGLSTKLLSLFESTDAVSRINVSCLIDPLINPRSFLELIRAAYSVTKFEATFIGPNMYDADEYFQKPQSVYLQKANGEKGKTLIEGKNLNVDVITEVTKSAASRGNTASAKILENEGQKGKTIHLSDTCVTFQVPEDEFDKQEAIAEMRQIYKEIRE